MTEMTILLQKESVSFLRVPRDVLFKVSKNNPELLDLTDRLSSMGLLISNLSIDKGQIDKLQADIEWLKSKYPSLNLKGYEQVYGVAIKLLNDKNSQKEAVKNTPLYQDEEILLGQSIDKAMVFLKAKDSGVKYSKDNSTGEEIIGWRYMGPFGSDAYAIKVFFFQKDVCDSIVFKQIGGVNVLDLLSKKGYVKLKYDSVPADKKNPNIIIKRYYEAQQFNVLYIVVRENKRFDYTEQRHLVFTPKR
jgi:hypothetical protein